MISKLPPERKKKAWQLIQSEAPALAEFMQSETYRLLRDQLGCSVVLTLDKGHIVNKRWDNEIETNKGETRGKH